MLSNDRGDMSTTPHSTSDKRMKAAQLAFTYGNNSHLEVHDIILKKRIGREDIGQLVLVKTLGF